MPFEESGSMFLRSSVLVLLVCITGCGPSRVEELISDVQSDDLKVRHAALRELAEIGPDARQASPVVVTAARDGDGESRRLACLALGSLFTEAAEGELPAPTDEVLSSVATCLNDKQTSVRMSAAFALLAMDSTHAEAQKTLLAAMKRGDGGIIDRIGRRQPAATWAVSMLVEILQDDRRPGNRRLAAVALGRIGDDSDAVRQALQQASADPDDRVRAAAAEALASD